MAATRAVAAQYRLEGPGATPAAAEAAILAAPTMPLAVCAIELAALAACCLAAALGVRSWRPVAGILWW